MASTTLDPYPVENSLYIDGMKLGSGVDALTGNLRTESALKRGFGTRHSSDPFETQTLKFDHDISELSSDTFALSDSITFPSDKHALGVKTLFGSAGNANFPMCTVFIVLEWSRVEKSSILEAQLSKEAIKIIRGKNPTKFGLKYGDYFVASILYNLIFTVIWYYGYSIMLDLSPLTRLIQGVQSRTSF